MILLSKKRINLILISILVGVLTFSIKSSVNEEEIIKETTSLPVSGKTVIVDAGHGTPDEGAESSSRYNRSTN